MRRAYKLWQDGMSVYKASKLTGVPEQTLRDRTCGYTPVDQHHSGKDRLLTHDDEKEMVEHIKYVASVGYGYTRREIAQLAGETAFFVGRKTNPEAMSDKWVYNFLKRWPDLKITKPKALCMVRAKSATKETVSKYYQELDRILKKYDLHDKPHRIFNVDETGLSPEHNPPQAVVARGNNFHLYSNSGLMYKI